MGQARQRKISDKLYGKVRNSQKFRGLVITCPMRISGSELYVKESWLHPDELRYGLLYWDKLVWPSSRAIHIGGGGDEEFLVSAGVLDRPDYTVWGDGAQGILHGVLNAFKDLQDSQPRAWALLEGENSISYQRDESEKRHALGVELSRCIPIPKGDVPFLEILEFKEKRRDELLLLRAEIERLESLAKLSNDPVEFVELAKHDIDKACRDILRVSSEWRFPIALADKSVEFSFEFDRFITAYGVVNGLAMAPAFESVLPGATQVVAGLAGVASQFKVSAKPKIVGFKKDLGAYAYAYRMHKELGYF
ncbi:MAG: DUF6236 family protein [Pseudomonas sp.]|nr:DUF6236 family protein [Pseudomonas sp.]